MDLPNGPTCYPAMANDDRADDALGRIAAALGRAKSDFRGDRLANAEAGAADLMCLWMALRSESARARVLSAARAAVAAQTKQ